MTIYDILSREISILVKEELKQGSYEYRWDASNYSSGLYFYKLETEEFFNVKKMVLVK